jgi:hypothetical protein
MLGDDNRWPQASSLHLSILPEQALLSPKMIHSRLTGIPISIDLEGFVLVFVFYVRNFLRLEI